MASFHVTADVSSDDPAVRPVLEQLGAGTISERPDGFCVHRFIDWVPKGTCSVGS